MVGFANHIDVKAIEAEAAWEDRDMPTTLYQLLASVATRFPNRNAMTFQLTSGPKDPAETLSWQEFHDQSVQAANLFRSLGVGPTDVVAYLLPNATETALTLIGGGIAGDFAICAVPCITQDLRREVPYWGYFCQISDSTTSYGSYSGAVPNEKITWGKLSASTPKFIIESDASIVAPLVFASVLGW